MHGESTQIISAFVDSLTLVFKNRDFRKYDSLWVQPSDKLVDLHGGKLRQELAITDDNVRKPKDLEAQFVSTIDRATELLGSWSAVELEKFEYRIENGPAASDTGLFRFEVTLFFARDGKRCRIVQPMCAKTTRGIVIGNAPILLKEE